MHKNTALIIIDVQKAFYQVESLADSFKNALPKIKMAMSYFEQDRILFTRTSEAYKLEISSGFEIIEDLKVSDLKIYNKDFPSIFKETDLLHDLKTQNIDTLILCGCFSMACVYESYLHAIELGFDTKILKGGTISNVVDSIKELELKTKTYTF